MWQQQLDLTGPLRRMRPANSSIHPCKATASHRVFVACTQPTDIATEQAKLLWADAVIFQFPLWWFSMRAILKGRIDRLYAHSFAYGVGEQSESHWGARGI
jgi:NAD(P)H dehydrogenase (quinone)